MTIDNPSPTFHRREWLLVGLVALLLLAITAIPAVVAYRTAPPDKQFMGVIFNIPDHIQYFSWMRESQNAILVRNQLTPEDSQPLLFNFLWWTLGRIQAITGWDTPTLFQLARLAAGVFVVFAVYYFCGLVFEDRLKRWTAFLVATVGAGLGWILVIYSQLTQPGGDLVIPFATYTSEPNTFFTILAFPHFAIAIGLITVIFGFVLLGQRTQKLRYAWLAGATSLLLGVQHAYDLFTIYGVIGVYFLFVWLRDRRFPVYLFKLGLIVGLISVWPALQAYYITTADPVMKGVLEQFDNAGAFTPPLWQLPFLMGIAWLLAIWALDIRTPWRARTDTDLLILAWFLSHFLLIYLPIDFQIHLLSGWQVATAVLAVIGLYRRVIPWLQKHLRQIAPVRLALYTSAVLVLIVIPTNLYLLAWRTLDLRRGNSPYFLRTSEVAALDYLESQAQHDDVVLSSEAVGQFVPYETGARSFLGHWAQTLDYYGKRDMVNAFFADATSDAERQDILRRYRVNYVLHGPEEQAIGNFNPASVSYLKELYREGDVTVYSVNLDT